MSQLGDKQIKDTYSGIIKTQDEGAIGTTPKRLQDGEGNNLPLDVTTTQTRFYGTADFTNATVTGLSGGGGGATYDLTLTGTQAEPYINLVGSNGTTDTVSIKAGDNMVFNVAQSPTGGQIEINSTTFPTYINGYNNSINLVAGTNITITETVVSPTSTTFTFDASGGGGGGTPIREALSLPPAKGSFLNSAESFKTWVPTTGYGTAASSSISNGQAVWSYFPMAEGDTIRKIYFNIHAASTGGNALIGIYAAEQDANGQLVVGDLLQDCGTVSSTTAGDKFITLGTPFTMPSGQNLGAVCIVIGGDAPETFSVKCWAQGVWNGNGGRPLSGTFYRNIGLYITSWDGSHHDYSTASYGSTTSNPLMVGIQP